jgi:hypothetical protein
MEAAGVSLQFFHVGDKCPASCRTLAKCGVPEDEFFELKKEKRQDWLAE